MPSLSQRATTALVYACAFFAVVIAVVGGVGVVGVRTAIDSGNSISRGAGRRRIRKAFEPQRDQVDFGNTLQIADDEAEAHQLLQRHLERTLVNTSAVVLNRNNSADRLEAVTPMPPGSTLVTSLAKAEPCACLAVRSGRTHTEDEARPGLLACSASATRSARPRPCSQTCATSRSPRSEPRPTA